MKKIYSLLLLGGLLFFGVQNACADDNKFTGGNMYFDNTVTNWSANFQNFIIGKDGYSEVRTLADITNTKVKVAPLPTSGWNDATYIGVVFVNGETEWQSGYWGPSKLEDATYYSKVNLGDWKSNGQTYTMAPGSPQTNLMITHRGDNYSKLNEFTQTVGIKVAGADGSYSAPSEAIAALSGTGYKYNSWNTCSTTANGSVTKGSTTTTMSVGGGFCACVTLSYSNLASGYTFVGWYDGSGNELSTSASYDYYPNNAGSVYAYFRPTAYTLTVSIPFTCGYLKAYVWRGSGDDVERPWDWEHTPVIVNPVNKDTEYSISFPEKYDHVIWRFDYSGNQQTIDLPFGNYKYTVGSKSGDKYEASISKHIVPTPDGFATFYSDDYFAELPVVSEQQVKAYTATISGDNTYLDLYVIENYNCVPKSTGVILKSVNAEYDVILKESATPGTVNGSHANSLTGTSETISTPANSYVLGYANSTTKFFAFTGASIPANKAYLVIPSGNAPSAMRIIDEENNATNINNIDAFEEAVKFFQNGKLFIKKNGIVYDMMGTIVK